ncbi:helix-turn-helix domain-containing protein [Streptosporangium sp. NPDC004631]
MLENIATPGDLGRRVAKRRRALGLTRQELAGRAGIDPGYLAYLEENAASPTAGTVERLAAALDTSGEELLGGAVGRLAERDHTAATPRLEGLSADECLRLISPGGVGRVAYDGPSGPVILPVDYVVHGGAVLLRTAFGGSPDRNPRTGVKGAGFEAAFEVDRIDEVDRRGWSVLVQGTAHHISSGPEQVAVTAADVEPWAGGERELRIRIVPAEISGRRIHHTTR